MSSITASRGVASITPPSSSHGTRDWDYAVPLDTPDDDGNTYYSYANRKNTTGSNRSRKGSLAKVRPTLEERKTSGSYVRSNSDYSKEPPRNPHPYGTNAPIVSNNQSDFLAAPRAPALTKPGSDPSDGDSNGDPYAAHRLSTMSGVTEILPNVNGSATAMYDLTGDIDNREASSWIHRDKLMRIESHEFRKSSPNPNDAWIKTAQRKMSVDRISKARGTTRESHKDAEGFSDELFEDNDCDLRLPEEREAELFAQRMAAARTKSNTPSKIPVNISSPAPIPLEFLERNSPLKRPRSDSTDDDDVQSISYPHTRMRSLSLESQEPPVTPPEKPTTASTASVTPPSKVSNRLNQSKVQGSPRRPSSSHRTSQQNAKTTATSKPRTVSSSGNRISASNSAAPGAVKHSTPEGPPPWALGTYAPDPKLPQDQQIIPTVAKRLQQEQWEREGVSASVYDRELRPLKIHDNEGEPKEAMNFGEQSTLWSLPSEKQRDNPPMIEPTNPKTQEASRSQAREPIRVKDPEAVPGKGKKDKGCCGCTIM